MPINYEVINPNTDVATTKTLLHEVIPLTGTIVSGTYGTFPNEGNIKNYSHGMFQSVYDYPYLSSLLDFINKRNRINLSIPKISRIGIKKKVKTEVVELKVEPLPEEWLAYSF